jgi:hypothetical protein
MIALPLPLLVLPAFTLSHMARGRPALDPELKTQHVQESRRRYEEKYALEYKICFRA